MLIKKIYILTFLGTPIIAFPNKEMATKEINQRECNENNDYSLITCFLQFPENDRIKKINFKELEFEN